MSGDPFETHATALRMLEAVLFAARAPLSLNALAERLPADMDIAARLIDLQAAYANRGVHLVKRGEGWAFRTAPDLAHLLTVEREQARRLSRAAMETLAIIAYHQPVTRADIETIRGVATSRGTLDALVAAEWVKPGRRRETPGRPSTWITTPHFLDHFGLESLKDLPRLEELKASGLLDTRPAIDTLADAARLPLDEEDTDAPEPEPDDPDQNDED